MFEILYRSGILILIIAFGYLVKVFGWFSKEEDFATISKLIINITLPAAVMTNLNGLRFPTSLLFILIFAILCNSIYILLARRFGQDNKEKAFMTISVNGYNVGGFALPFIAFFLEGVPILAASLFDAGNSIMILSANYTLAENVQNGHARFDMKGFIKSILTMPPILVYFLMVILSLTSLNLPTVVLDIASIIGSSNTFLAMFMIGLALEFNFENGHAKKLTKYMLVRYVPALIIVVALSFIAFIPDEIKHGLSLLVMAPIAGSAPIFTGLIGNDVELSAQVNSLSIITSIVLMSSYLVYLGL